MAYGVNDPWLVLQASTGFGKSTSFVYFLLANLRFNVIVFVPRVSIAKNVAQYLEVAFKNLKMGENLGYITGSGSIRPSHPKAITFITVQLLTNFVDGSDANRQDTIFVVDEVHEWHSNTAINWGLYLIREQQLQNLKMSPVIFMSATPPTEIIAEYLLHRNPLPYIEIGRKQEEISDDILHIEKSNVFDKCVQYIRDHGFKKILIFNIGLQIKARESIMINGENYGIFKLDRTTMNEDPDSLKYYSSLSRAIILVTPLGDLGITVEKADCVMNPLVTYMMIYCTQVSTNLLAIVPSNLSTYFQRRGRTGRTGPGTNVLLINKDMPLDVKVYDVNSTETWGENTSPKMAINPSYEDCLQLYNSPESHLVIPTAGIYEEHIHAMETAGILNLDVKCLGIISNILQKNKIGLEDFTMFLVMLDAGFTPTEAAMIATYARWEFKPRDLKHLEVLINNPPKEIDTVMGFCNKTINIKDINPKLRILLFEIYIEAKLRELIFLSLCGPPEENSKKITNTEKMSTALKTYYPGRLFQNNKGKITRPGYGQLKFARMSLEPNTKVRFLTMKYNHVRNHIVPIFGVRTRI